MSVEKLEKEFQVVEIIGGREKRGVDIHQCNHNRPNMFETDSNRAGAVTHRWRAMI